MLPRLLKIHPFNFLKAFIREATFKIIVGCFSHGSTQVPYVVTLCVSGKSMEENLTLLIGVPFTILI